MSLFDFIDEDKKKSRVNDSEYSDDELTGLDDLEKESVKKGYNDPWDFEEEEKDDDSYYEDDD